MSMELEKEIIRLQRELASERAEHAETEGKLIDYKHLAEHANRKREQAEAQLAKEIENTNRLHALNDSFVGIEAERDAARAQVERLRGMLKRAFDIAFDDDSITDYAEMRKLYTEIKLALSDAPPPAAKETT